MKKNTMLIGGISLIALSTSTVYADTQCSGTLSGVYDNVVVNGTACTLAGATVRGSVLVSNAGTLLATGNTSISGGVQVDGGGNIDIDSATALGDVAIFNSADAIVGSGATAGVVKFENSNTLTVSGNVGSIESSASGAIQLDGATVFPGGVTVNAGLGGLTLCGATVEAGINVALTTGSVSAEASATCAASSIDGSVIVGTGTGDVRLVGATMAAGDLLVSEQNGDVYLDGTSLSDVGVSLLTGDITLLNTITDSDTIITNNSGAVLIEHSSLGSDVDISLNGAVTIAANSVSLEDVRVSSNAGPILIENNCDLMLSIVENDNVTLINNNEANATAAGATCDMDGVGLTFVDVNKNTGGKTLINNTGRFLACADNTPAPAGSNNVFDFTDGQCAGM